MILVVAAVVSEPLVSALVELLGLLQWVSHWCGIFDSLLQAPGSSPGNQMEMVVIATEDKQERFMDPNEHRCPEFGRCQMPSA